MIAIVLGAGFGTRMGELTQTCPKPLLPVAGRPMLEFLLDQVVAFPELHSIHVVTNDRYQARFIAWQRGWQQRFANKGIPLRVHNDGITDPQRSLEMAGDLRFVLERVGEPEGAVVAAGDNIYRFSLLPTWERFRRDATNLVLAMPEPATQNLRQTGVLELAENDRIVRFHEKPQHPPSHWKCPALYFLTAAALRVARRYPPESTQHLMSYLLDHEDIFAEKTAAGCLPVGTARAYEAVDRIIREEGVWQEPPQRC